MAGTDTIRSIGIVTAGRPALVRRALSSIVAHCRTHDRRPRIIVVDGSPRDDDRTETRAAVDSLSGTSPVEYVGVTEAAALCRDLRGPEDDWPLVPGAAGANRNILLLLTAGERLLMLDDDVLVEPWAAAGRSPHVARMSAAGEWIHTAFFDDRSAALAAARPVGDNLLATHEAWLGQEAPFSVPSVTGVRVRVTMSGVAGDAGIYCPHRLLLAGGPLGGLLSDDAGALARALRSREVHRVARCTAITTHPACMTTCTGLDNTEPLPPFPLEGTNEDGVFGALLASTCPGVAFAHLPIGIVHDSPRPSRRGDGPPLSATQTRLAELLMAWLRRSSEVDRPPERRLMSAADRLLTLGAMAPEALKAEAAAVGRTRRERDLVSVRRLVDSESVPAHIRAAAAFYREVLEANLARPDFSLPIEFEPRGSPTSGYEALGRSLSAFGRLMRAWPDVWRRARARNRRAERSAE